MHTDTESTSEIEEDFFNALALLHSTEENSIEKLRQMLDACIEKKYGYEKTLAVRMPQRFLQKVEWHDNVILMQTLKKRDNIQEHSMKNEIGNGSETIPLLKADTTLSTKCRTADVKIYKVDYDYSDEENIPRISIPDEGSADGTVCKICNGAKLGPLILLECQECQEAYHPLCHQPPVIDIDVYDPRIVWRCRRCIEISSISANDKIIQKVQQNDDAVKKSEKMLLKVPGKRDSASFGNDSVKNKKTQFSEDFPLFTKNLTNPSQRNEGLPSSLQSRKRIGSKLSIARPSIK